MTPPPFLNEKQKRIFYGSAAQALGHSGVAFVNEVTGSTRNTIQYEVIIKSEHMP